MKLLAFAFVALLAIIQFSFSFARPLYKRGVGPKIQTEDPPIPKAYKPMEDEGGEDFNVNDFADLDLVDSAFDNKKGYTREFAAPEPPAQQQQSDDSSVDSEGRPLEGVVSVQRTDSDYYAVKQKKKGGKKSRKLFSKK